LEVTISDTAMPGAHLLAQLAERPIGDARHGGDDQVVLELEGSDLHGEEAKKAGLTDRRKLRILYARTGRKKRDLT
jgi:hypothetical protein